MLVVFEDGEEAMRSALRIRDEVGLNLESIGLSVGIGINTGQVTEGALGSSIRKNYDVVGAAVNIASRICNVAGPNEILVSESIFLKMKTNFVSGQQRSITVKGISEELLVFPLVGTNCDSQAGPNGPT